MSSLQRYRLILVGPMYAGNVGACARVAANFDLNDIWIVDAACDWKNREAQTFARGPAAKFLDQMSEAKDLRSALEPCTAAIGFTRRDGELRRAATRLSQLSKVGEHQSKKKVALVFGREDGGLTHEELLLCTHVCSFATAGVMPSLNLSHAVALTLGSLYEQLDQAWAHSVATNVDSVSLKEFEALIDHWREAMLDARIIKAGNPERMLAHIKRALQRADLSVREVGYLRAYLSKTQYYLHKRPDHER